MGIAKNFLFADRGEKKEGAFSKNLRRLIGLK
jgi:hypothetical protein